MRRRELLAATGAVAGSLAGASTISSSARAEHEELQPDHVTITYDESLINEYKPRFVLQDVDPRPTAWHALHAESSESDLNAVYGFMLYAYQEGGTRHDSHLGDHEPLIVWYDQASGDVERVDFAAYHWFRGTATPDQLEFVDSDTKHRPIFRVDPTYHHYYAYSGGLAGADVAIEDLTASMPRWLNNGLEDELARSQPYDPWQMLARNTWWHHSAGNWVDAYLKAVWFNVGASGAAETSDLGEARTW